MPTNLKNLLSRSRSRNELKGRGDKEEIPGGVCSCSLSIDTTSPPSLSHHHHDGFTLAEIAPPTTCQCQSIRVESPGKLPTNPICPSISLRRETSSRSLFSLPAENSSVTSRPTSPADLPQNSSVLTSQPLAMRKCETVLALSSFNGSSSFSGDSSSSSPTPSPTRVKVMKDRILSTSSSALTTLLQNSAKSRLFSGWKLSPSSKTATTSHPHDHYNHQPTSATPPPHSYGMESARSQASIYESHGTSPLTPTNRLRRHGSVTNSHPFWLTEISRHSSLSSVTGSSWRPADDHEQRQLISCRLCLCDVSLEHTVKILNCSCRYCKDCVTAYVSFEVEEGAYDIACPDATCQQQGVLSVAEIEVLVPSHIFEKYKKFRRIKEVETDCELMWCPTPGCETICKRIDSSVNGPAPTPIPIIQCSRCQHVYCTECRLPIHSDQSCESYRQKLIRQGKLNLIDEEPFASCDSIKKCPFCHVPIEKDSGCAQMMCKRCKHVFCWYCLSSLDDDFLLRHYDHGPCKNKLGHSRASVVWHRTQVIGIFAGFGLLVLLASPLLILAAPCLLCCRCRYCSSHLDPPDDSPVSI